MKSLVLFGLLLALQAGEQAEPKPLVLKNPGVVRLCAVGQVVVVEFSRKSNTATITGARVCKPDEPADTTIDLTSTPEIQNCKSIGNNSATLYMSCNN